MLFIMVETSNLDSSRRSERRPRLADNLVRVQFKKSNGQFKVSLPRGLAKSLRLNSGDILEVFYRTWRSCFED